MKVAFISTNGFSPWGGSEELWSQTAIRMANQGFTIAVNVKGWEHEAKQISEMERSNCMVVRRWNYRNRWRRLADRLYRSRGVYTFLDEFNPKLVVISLGMHVEGLDWMSACLERNIPFVVIVQAAAENFWPGDENVIRLRQVYTAAIKCFFVSKANLNLTVKQLAVDLKNAKIIANPFKVPYDVNIPWPPENETLKLACVARLDPVAKGQDILFEVFKQEKWKDRNIHISLFGSGENKKSLLSLKQLWNLDNINFCGFMEKVESIWLTHHALVIPSRYEGLPIALVEAMLCARPGIVTDIGGNSEIIEDNVNGFIATAPKVECLDDALERAWQKRDNWYKMGQNAAIRVREVIPIDPIAAFVSELELLLKK